MPRSLVALWSSLLAFFTALFRSPPATRTPTPERAIPAISLSAIFATPPDIELGPSPPHSRSPTSPVTPRPVSPTAMSDGSLEVISLGDQPARLPSPWSPIAKTAPPDAWMSVDGTLVNAAGPLDHDDYSAASRTAMLSLSTSPSALDAFGISVFVSLDRDQVRDENRPTLVTQTPRKRRDTLPSVTTHSARATKSLSTPLTKLDNVDVGHVRSATSISSMAYEFRMGLFADGRSMTALENIISLLDQASPESIPLHDGPMQPVEAN